jgi:hypothetical protein
MRLAGIEPDAMGRFSRLRSSGAKTVTREITPQPFSGGQALVAPKLTRDGSITSVIEHYHDAVQCWFVPFVLFCGKAFAAAAKH